MIIDFEKIKEEVIHNFKGGEGELDTRNFVDENNKIGFADHKGKIIIKPQFEIATTFHKGKAIIGKGCEKIPWDEHAKEEDCQHF